MAEPPVFESAYSSEDRPSLPVDQNIARRCNAVAKTLQEQLLAAYATSQELDTLLRSLAVDDIQAVDITQSVNLDLAHIEAVLQGENSMIYANERAAAQLRTEPKNPSLPG